MKYDVDWFQGSSPLTRGKQVAVRGACGVGGLIPAHAGKTAASARPSASCRAHPRSRGENEIRFRPGWLVWGSSPLTRGKPDPGTMRSPSGGLIPAHAGKTQIATDAVKLQPAHPRSRGENVSGSYPATWQLGSSPLTRGKPSQAVSTGGTRGLIPAHAGKTLGRANAPRPGGAHPRSRGENCVVGDSGEHEVGSSPLTRGKPTPSSASHQWRRLIPAHAGKTSDSGESLTSVGAHPRSRGENPRATRAPRTKTGSSPLTRGKPGSVVCQRDELRLIPAHAGKTGRPGGWSSSSGAHPRSRGENYRSSSACRSDEGSSPLTRGKLHSGTSNRLHRWAHPRSRGENHVYRFSGSQHWWLIPAHAGKTKMATPLVATAWAHPRSRGENAVSLPVVLIE